MTEAPKSKSPSTLKIIFYLLLGIGLLTLFLEMSGMADVVGKREKQEIIDRPHQ